MGPRSNFNHCLISNGAVGFEREYLLAFAADLMLSVEERQRQRNVSVLRPRQFKLVDIFNNNNPSFVQHRYN